MERLLGEGIVADSVDFPEGPLVYSLLIADDVPCAQASFQDRQVQVRVPRLQALAWGNGVAVGISSSGVTPAVLVEKDFVRTAVEESDDFDRFMNPRSGRMPPPPAANHVETSRGDDAPLKR